MAHKIFGRLKQGLQGSRKELVDSLYLIALQGINQFLPLLVLPYLMVVLGATGYGYIGFSLSVVQYLVLVVDFGFNLSATRRIAQVRDNREELTRVFWSVFWAKLVLLAGALLLLAVLLLAVPTFQKYRTALLCTLPMLVGSAFTFLWLFQGIGRVRQMAIINTTSKIIMLPLIFWLVKTPADYPLAAFIQSGVFVLTAVISIVYMRHLRCVGRPVREGQAIRQAVSESFPLFLSSASTSVYTQLFVVILGFYCSTDVVGRYSSAERIMRALCFVLYTPINQAFFPRISAAAVSDAAQARKVFTALRNLVAAIMLVVGVCLFAGAPYVSYFLGNEYAGIEDLLHIFAFAPIFIGLGGVYGQSGLVAMGQHEAHRHFRNVYFMVAVMALAMVAVLTPLFRETGAAMALLASEAAVFVLMRMYARRDLRL